jgi:RNA polymerase sigma-70 factor (ECF subfamily)
VESQLEDFYLLDKVRDSDEEAFRVLFCRYQPVLFRHVLFQTRQTDLAHDIVQETFVRIWERRSFLKPRLSFLAYILRISSNLVRDATRQRRTRDRLRENILPPALSEGDDPVEALQHAALQKELMGVINDELPDRCRTVFLLSRFEEKTNREIAALLGLSVRTVEHQINHALKVIRRKLKVYLR